MLRHTSVALLLLSLVQSADNQYFAIAKVNGVDWLRTPRGSLFFSNGVNVVDDGNALPRLRAWKFNTLGAWSDPALEHKGVPFTVDLHLGANRGFPWNDFFHERFAAEINRAAQLATARYRGNRELIGYFSDNELGWWGATIFRYHLQQPKESATRRKLFAILREHYHNNFAALDKDWYTPGSDAWENLESGAAPQLFLRPQRHGMEAIQAFVGACAERYYTVATEALRRADPGRLILGDRYAGYFENSIARSAGRHLDAVSTNYGTEFLDGSLSHFYLDLLHRVAAKPLLVTEYYFAARENNSGNRNTGEIFPVVQTQAARARSFVRNLTGLAAIPYCAGAHWFQYRDEPAAGRSGDREDYNMGLVDINGAPYRALTEAAALLDTARIHRSPEPTLPSLRPVRAPADPWTGLLSWPREHAFVLPERPESPADLYVVRSPDATWLGILYMDYIDPKLYRTPSDLDADLARLTIHGPAIGGIEILVTREGAPHISGKHAEARISRHSTRVTLLARIPPTESLVCSLRGSGGAWESSWKWRATAPSHQP